MISYPSRKILLAEFQRRQPSSKILLGQHHHLSLSDVKFRVGLNLKDQKIHTGWSASNNYAIELGFWMRKTSQDVLNSIIVDLVSSAANDCGVSYHRGTAHYQSRQTGIFGRHRIINAIDFLVSEGLVYNFIVPAGSNVPLTSFMYATDKLLKKYSAKTVCNGLTEHSSIKSVVYRQRLTERLLKSPQTEFSAVAEKELILQNDFLSGFQYGYDSTIENHRSYTSQKGHVRNINLLKIKQRRIFLIDKDQLLAGRYYGGFWQGISSDARAKITINDEIVGDELDYKCLHLQLAYASVGKKLDGDGYKIPIKHLSVDKKMPLMTFGIYEERKIVKKIILISLNARNLSAAKGALLEDIENMFPNFMDDYSVDKKMKFMKTIIKAVQSHHNPISECFNKDCGVKYQFYDGEMMTEIQKQCREKGIPVLGVHDSILFPVSDTETVKKIFNKVLNDYLQKIRFQSLLENKTYQI